MSNANLNRELPEWLASAFKTVDWPVPPYLKIEFLCRLAKTIEDAAPDLRSEIMRQNFAHAYSPEYLATMLLERYSKIALVQDFTPQIDESIKAYFSGYNYVAVTGLIPVVEGVIRKIAILRGRNVGRGTNGINVELQAFVQEELNSPHAYGERVVLLEAFRDFIKDRFLRSTDGGFGGLDELNRHGIIHGIFQKFGQLLSPHHSARPSMFFDWPVFHWTDRRRL